MGFIGSCLGWAIACVAEKLCYEKRFPLRHPLAAVAAVAASSGDVGGDVT